MLTFTSTDRKSNAVPVAIVSEARQLARSCLKAVPGNRKFTFCKQRVFSNFSLFFSAFPTKIFVLCSGQHLELFDKKLEICVRSGGLEFYNQSIMYGTTKLATKYRDSIPKALKSGLNCVLDGVPLSSMGCLSSSRQNFYRIARVGPQCCIITSQLAAISQIDIFISL